MPPAKSRANHDDSKSDAPSTKEKNGTGSKENHTNGGTKLRRVASSAGSNLKEVATINGHSAVATTPAAPQPALPPGV
jgi:histone deacetylase complex subunit SAP30